MRFSIVLLAVLSFCVICAPADAQSPYYGDYTILVPVDQSWTDTGVDVLVGQRLIILASGTATASAIVPGVPQWYGPDGVGGNCGDPNKPYKYWALNMLVGKIGDAGEAIPVGSFRGVQVETPGRLYLGVNDGIPADAMGLFVAVIYVIDCGSASMPEGGVRGGSLMRTTPNPFGGTVNITFELPASARTVLQVYDPSGRVVRTLVDETLDPGPHQVVWDGTSDSGDHLATGLYFAQLRVNGSILGTQKAVLLE